MEIVTDIIRALEAKAGQVTSGFTHYIAFRSYPTVLVMTCYGVALERAGRLDVLRKLLNISVKREYREPQRLVDCRFLWSWPDASSDETWRPILDKGRHVAPLSEHLLDLVKQWGSGRFLTLTHDVPFIFERYEMLASLTHFEQHPLDDVRQSLSQRDDFVFMPVGRSGWHEETSKQIFSDFESAEGKETLKKAGYLKDGDERLGLFRKNFYAVARRMRW